MSKANMYFPPSISQEPRGSMRITRERERHPSRVREYADQMINFFNKPYSSPTSTESISVKQADIDSGSALRQPSGSSPHSNDSHHHWFPWSKDHEDEKERLNDQHIAFDETETGGAVFGMIDPSGQPPPPQSMEKKRGHHSSFHLLPRADEVDSNLVDSLFSDT